MIGALKIHPGDNVEVALADGGDVPRGHKRALADIPEGGLVVKYGRAIGHATRAIRAGEHVHTHNLATNLGGALQYEYAPVETPELPRREGSFLGFVRPDGSVGVRNELWILPTVGCANATCARLAREINRELGEERAFSFPHPYGCSQMGEDQLTTQRTLTGLVRHPNAGGVLVVGLGCENNSVAAFQAVLGDWDRDRVRFLVLQDEPDEIEAGLALLRGLASYADRFVRQKVPLSALVVGLKCGGSDGLSGITANPLVGRVSDLLVAAGGRSVLTEVPEMFGAETELMARCLTRALFCEVVDLVNGFKRYYADHGQVVYENPSPGNKAGGITTLEDKSLGCTQKGGTSPVRAVVQLGGRITEPGLNLLWGPGNDIVAVTNLAAAGCQLILFTTGRGTPLGGPVPTLKIASNGALAEGKPHWVDFDAGRALMESMDALAEDLMGLVVQVASGAALAKNERNGYREIAIFKDGVTL